MTELTDLAALVSPSTKAAFIESFLVKERLLIKSDRPGRAESLLPRWAIDRLLASSFLPAERLHVLRNGEVVPGDSFRAADGRIRLDALETLISEGVSFVVNGIDQDIAAVDHLTASVERELGHRAWANAYVTHGAGGALAPHYDDHDVVVLQAHGAKRWFGYGTPHPSPIERSPDDLPCGEPVWDLLLEPGDLLYLPRGEIHRASVVGPISVHLTIGIEPRRGVDLWDSMGKRAREVPLFREDITRLAGPQALLLRERQLKDAMHALVEATSLDHFLRADETELARARSERK